MRLTAICSAMLMAAPASGAEAVQRAVAWLAVETPRWPVENHCFSCHNNGDAARALFLAASRGYAIAPRALDDTVRWLRHPAGWEHNRGNPAFSDQRLARLQFTAALAEASRTGYTRDPQALRLAAEAIAADQDGSGSWPIDTGGVAGAPATWGATLATYMGRRTLETADSRRFADAVARANGWLNAAQPANVPDRAAILLALPATAPRHLEPLLAAQTSDGGWGPQPHAPAEGFDTALVLLALAGLPSSPRVDAAIVRGRGFLEKFQLNDGSWPETTRPSGFTSYAERVSTAGWAAYALMITDAKRK